MAIITGTESSENLNGTNDADTIDGLGGNDGLYGLDGDDTINGGEGNDTLSGGFGNDVLNGDGGNDTLVTDISGTFGPAEPLSAGDRYNGGDGTDTVMVKGTPYGYVTTVLRLGTDLIYTGIERLVGENLVGFSGTASVLSAFQYIRSYEIVLTDTALFAPTSDLRVQIVRLADGGASVDLRATGIGAGEVYGGTGNDTIFGANQSAYPGNSIKLDGGAGNDTIWGGSAGEILVDGNGNDQVHGGGGDDFFLNGSGDDSFYGEDGDDYFSPGELSTISLNDWFYGGAGFDTIQISASSGTINISGLHLVDIEKLVVGGAISMTTQQVAQFQAIEAQTLTLLSTGSVTMVSAPGYINLFSGGNTVDLSGSSGFHQVTGNAGADTIIGGDSYEFLYGYGANDTIYGNGGDDYIDGGTGTDLMHGGTGDDRFIVERQQDVVFENAGEGIDTVEAFSPYYLYPNIERLILNSAAANAFGVGNALDNYIEGNNSGNLLLGGAGADTVLGMWGNDNLFGEDGNDSITGDLGVDYIAGGAGDDVLNGGWDADAIYGEDGNDTLYGGETFDTDILVGGAGNDIHYANSGLGDYDILNGAAGNDTYYVDTPNDVIYEGLGEGTDTVFAEISGAGYYLWANVENCFLTGSTPFAAGNDLDNLLVGSSASNWLLGNNGNDTLDGGAGNDVLFGDKPGGTAGNDTFVFASGSGQDVIGDFHIGEDKIRLIGSYTTFAEVSSHFIQNSSNGAIDFGGGNFVVLNGVTMSSLTASDFIFG